MALTVNGQLIPEEAVQYELNRLVQFYSTHMSTAQIKEQMETLRKRAREQAVGAKLLMEQAEKLDLKVPAEPIDEKLAAIVESSGGQEKFAETLLKQGVTEDELRKSIERGCRVDMLVAQVTGDIPDPTEEEMQAHFEAHAHEYIQEPRAQAQHILIKPASESDADRETARSKLLEIREKIVEGADFSDMAAAHSECPSGSRSGGSLGWFSAGMMVTEFDAAVFSMAVGELSEIVETPLGLHLIYKTGFEEGGEPEFAAVNDKVRDFLRHVRRGEALSAYVRELAEKAVIEGL